MIDVVQRMLDRRRLLQGGVAAGGALALGDFMSRNAVAQEASEGPSDASDLEGLIAAAQQENAIVSYGMPPEWANLGEMWDSLPGEVRDRRAGKTPTWAPRPRSRSSWPKKTTRSPTSARSASSSRRPRSSSASSLPFKNDTWDEIPDWAKHPDGLWATAVLRHPFLLGQHRLRRAGPAHLAGSAQTRIRGLVTIDDPAHRGAGQLRGHRRRVRQRRRRDRHPARSRLLQADQRHRQSPPDRPRDLTVCRRAKRSSASAGTTSVWHGATR